tara:strand:+ start:442 stop:582 length:141 start_codon:yes stop_codon:yes gene_type:complete
MYSSDPSRMEYIRDKLTGGSEKLDDLLAEFVLLVNDKSGIYRRFNK